MKLEHLTGVHHRNLLSVHLRLSQKRLRTSCLILRYNPLTITITIASSWLPLVLLNSVEPVIILHSTRPVLRIRTLFNHWFDLHLTNHILDQNKLWLLIGPLLHSSGFKFYFFHRCVMQCWPWQKTVTLLLKHDGWVLRVDFQLGTGVGGVRAGRPLGRRSWLGELAWR